MRTLLLIPSVVKPRGEDAVPQPTMDYHALAAALDTTQGAVDLLDYSALDQETHPLVRLARRWAGRDAALALAGFLRQGRYDALFTNGENIGIPLALLLKLTPRRAGHVTIGHRLSAGKKRLFFTLLQAHRQIDTIFLYAQSQIDFAEDRLGIPADKLRLIAFHADDHFYRPQADAPPADADQICSAGLEWRDYPTLLDAVKDMPELRVRLAAASPWSKHRNETADRTLPPNVEARRYTYDELRDLYAASGFVVVPLYENDFQAGVTTILEAMAMGKAVIATRTTGQTDVITEGETGLSVPPGDVIGWREAIQRLRSDTALRARLGRNARLWVEQHASLSRWVRHMVGALEDCARPGSIAAHVPETASVLETAELAPGKAA
jgi:glycosyltransferase involved in cell wall biosynthesis